MDRLTRRSFSATPGSLEDRQSVALSIVWSNDILSQCVDHPEYAEASSSAQNDGGVPTAESGLLHTHALKTPLDPDLSEVRFFPVLTPEEEFGDSQTAQERQAD